MKKNILLGVIICLSTTICACGNDAPSAGTYDGPKLVSKEERDAKEKQEEQQEQQEQPQEEQQEAKETSSDNGAICDTCTVAIKDYVLSKDTDGKDIIIINFDFSNSDSEGKSFSISASTQVFQDGVELSHAYFVENYSSENSLKQVRDGATIAVQDAFELNNLTSPVEVEVSDTFDFLGKSEILKKTFELQ